MATPSLSRIGVIGCGNISKAYFTNCKLYPNLEVVACADLDVARAQAQAAEFGVPRGLAVDDLLASPDIDIVVNLTIPQAHAAVDCQALAAGKHVFSEKPFTLNLEEGLRVQRAAQAAGRRIGCAPDTVLGAAVQTCRQLLDEGAIGQPLAFTALMQCGGHEGWHPSPEFYYQKGGGPMFDMGPYYLHALITLLGPVKRLSGLAKTSWTERTITSQPKHGQVMQVEVPTHLASLLEFQSGPIGTFVTSFDVKGRYTNPVIEIYGSEGTMQVPDPNGTGGQVRISKPGDKEWRDMPHTHGYAKGSRGLGVADLAAALTTGRQHRANDQVALHAVEIMEGVHESSRLGTHVVLSTTCERPLPMKADLPEFILD